jgi:hypothetical protein
LNYFLNGNESHGNPMNNQTNLTQQQQQIDYNYAQQTGMAVPNNWAINELLPIQEIHDEDHQL